MRHLDLLNEFRELISQLRREAEAASAMQLYDPHKIAEQVICGLLRELCGYSGMRNLNPEQSNFPGIDLADDGARVAIQVTATADLSKVKDTLKTFISHGLQCRYERVIVYVLTAKQGSYSQAAIDSVTADKLLFNADRDIWDYQQLCAKAAEVPPAHVQAVNNILKSYLRGVPTGLADEDIDPPPQPAEQLISNLLQIYFPVNLHIAQLNGDILSLQKKGKPRGSRAAVRAFNQAAGRAVPSAYVVHSDALITFFDLNVEESPYHHLIEVGTEEVHSSSEFLEIDEDHENVFKSLLRFSLQQRLFEERVHWYNEDKQFVFLPQLDNDDLRQEVWQGVRQSTRMVYARQYNKKDPLKVFLQKHLAFSVEFHRLSGDWLMSITPNWFFSYGKDFKKSGYGHENLSWIKRQENNRAVLNHFRFIMAWMKSIDDQDLFSKASQRSSFLSFGDNITKEGAPSLDESRWAALPAAIEDEAMPSTQKLFG